MCRSDIWKPVHYFTEKIESIIIERDQEKIDFVRDNLSDDESVYIFDRLLEYRRTNDSSIFLDLSEHIRHLQYFEPFLSFDNEGTFIDAGSYTADTSIEYV